MFLDESQQFSERNVNVFEISNSIYIFTLHNIYFAKNDLSFIRFMKISELICFTIVKQSSGNACHSLADVA